MKSGKPFNKVNSGVVHSVNQINYLPVVSGYQIVKQVKVLVVVGKVQSLGNSLHVYFITVSKNFSKQSNGVSEPTTRKLSDVCNSIL